MSEMSTISRGLVTIFQTR